MAIQYDPEGRPIGWEYIQISARKRYGFFLAAEMGDTETANQIVEEEYDRLYERMPQLLKGVE